LVACSAERDDGSTSAPLLGVVGAVVVVPVAAAVQLHTQELLSRARQSLTATATA
jgi:hypothetical protein